MASSAMNEPYEDFLSRVPEAARTAKKKQPGMSQQQMHAIEAALQSFFVTQLKTSEAYVGIVQAIKSASQRPEVLAQGIKFLLQAQMFIKTFMQQLALNEDQIVKVREMLEVMREIVVLNVSVIGKEDVDQDILIKLNKLKARFFAHFIPLMMAKEQVYGAHGKDDIEKLIGQFIIDSIDESLKSLKSNGGVGGVPTKKSPGIQLGEPIIPLIMPVNEHEDIEIDEE